jgi:hypothetical protein
MRLTDLGQRFSNWLGIAPDDPDALRNISRDAAAPESCVLREHTSHGDTAIGRDLASTSATSPIPDADAAITELRHLIVELRLGMDQHHEA